MKSFRKRIVLYILGLILIVSAFPLFASAANPFKDIKSSHPAYSSIEWAYNKGIIKGYPDGTFAPNQPITEEQFVAFLIRYDCSSPNSFKANKGEQKSSGNYRYLATKNLPLNGTTNEKLRTQPIKKGQVARIIAAYQGVDLSEAHAIKYMYDNDLAVGATGKNDYQDFGPNLSMTRAEIAVFLHKLSKQSDCYLTGLYQKPSGSDDRQYPLPLNFIGKQTVFFPKPEVDLNPPVATLPTNKPVIEFDVEKPTLIANGVDSTFVTLSLKSCSGSPISYDSVLAFAVTSKLGAQIEGDQLRSEIDWKPNSGYTNKVFYSDGPDITIKVTAPRSTRVQNDTISFELLNSSNGLDCYRESITTQLNYVPQAELRLEVENATHNNIPADGYATRRIKATVVLPGGQTMNYNGPVRFHSSKGAYLSEQLTYFRNGVASVFVTSIWSEQAILDEITAEFDYTNAWYYNQLPSGINTSQRIKLLYEPALRFDRSCSIGDLEVAFILDASGSMKRNDPNGLRITKSQDLLYNLNAKINIATKFNTRGTLIGGPDLPNPVAVTLGSVGASGGTNIADGLRVAFSNLNTDKSKQKVAILLTDGKSNEQQVLNQIQIAIDNNIKVYVIGLGNEKQINEKLLQKLATDTGGKYYHVEENIDIGIAYQSILSEITCGVPPLSCAYSDQVFTSPTLEKTNSDFFMNTFVKDRCGKVERVVLRFNSFEGDIDYELIDRGQSYFALRKGINEIHNFNLYKEGVFIAYDRSGKELGRKSVLMK